MSNSANNASSNSSGSNYINLKTDGLGIVTRIRQVQVRKSNPFVAASIAAMHGEKGVKDGVQFVPFDIKAATPEVEDILEKLCADSNDRNSRVMVQFIISDYYIDTFKYTTGTKAGQTGTMLKGRLLQIKAAWVKKLDDGKKPLTGWVLVYKKPAYQAPAQTPAVASEQKAEVTATGTDGANDFDSFYSDDTPF